MIPKSCKRLVACSASGHLQVLPILPHAAISFGQLLAAMEKPAAVWPPPPCRDEHARTGRLVGGTLAPASAASAPWQELAG